MISMYRILNDKHELIEADVITWATWFTNLDNRRVAEDIVGDFLVSTVCLGLNHSFFGKPLWFETMIFPKEEVGHDLYMDRYETWDEAVAGHKKACEVAARKEFK